MQDMVSNICKSHGLNYNFCNTVKIIVKWNQSGKNFSVNEGVLSKADLEPLTEADLVKGSQLLMDMKNKSYPVTVQGITSSVKHKRSI